MFKNTSISHYHGLNNVLKWFHLPSHHIWGSIIVHFQRHKTWKKKYSERTCTFAPLNGYHSRAPGLLFAVPVYFNGKIPFAKCFHNRKSPRKSDVYSIINLLAWVQKVSMLNFFMAVFAFMNLNFFPLTFNLGILGPRWFLCDATKDWHFER